jgi:hypothetical protein
MAIRSLSEKISTERFTHKFRRLGGIGQFEPLLFNVQNSIIGIMRLTTASKYHNIRQNDMTVS